MVELNNSTQGIKDFIDSSISRFLKEKSKPNSIGIFCCPWAGWITTNFNINRNIVETENNCPDFEFVAFDYLDLSDWQDEYETETPKFKLNGLIIQLDYDSGDEALNQSIFQYLKPLIVELKSRYDFVFLLQMLDSAIVEVI